MTAPKRIQYKRGQRKPEGAKIVTRISRWGNPFTVAEYGRDEAVRLHRDRLLAGTLPGVRNLHPVTVEDVRRELRGYDLGCSCGPGDKCHADTLQEIANGD